MIDKLIQGTAAGGSIRVLAAVTTGVLTEAVRRHETSPTVSAAFGRVLSGTLLLGATFKDLDRLTVRIDAKGPVESIVAETDGSGAVRGYVRNASVELPPSGNGKFNVAGIVGDGTLSVIREAGFEMGLRKDPYVGSVPLVSGEIAEDFAYYLAKSEQIPSAVLLGVLLKNSEPFVAASGGILIQMLPGASEDLISQIETSIQNTPHVTELIAAGAGPEGLLEEALGGLDFDILAESEVAFSCNCSFERAKALVSALGREEVESMLREQGGAVMTCGFCNETYNLDGDDLSAILGELDAER
ncbi:MAG: Hsp33 family molecular chaperone HslO [Chloracidobacterium sp.]|nr:Hsp33 family molecular chaperone HslO [Chloracidobacterium sp.]